MFGNDGGSDDAGASSEEEEGKEEGELEVSAWYRQPNLLSWIIVMNMRSVKDWTMTVVEWP